MSAHHDAAVASDKQYMLHGYTDLSEHEERGPVIITRGEGVRVFDDAGRDYIEAASGMWCATFGFSEQALIDAAAEQFARLPYYHTMVSRSVNPAIELAERLAKIIPLPDARIYFALSGSEANDFAVKFLRFYNNAIGRPKKKKVISRINGYHGATLAATSLTGIEKNHKLFDLPLPGFLHVSDPHYYRDGAPGESEDAFCDRLVAELEDLIVAEGPETVMAFFAEPVPAAGGVVIPPSDYYRKVQAVLKKYDVMFCADEVVTGFGRTGEMFGCETFGIKPDLMTMAKGLSGAYQPISAIALSDPIYRGMVSGSDEAGHFFAHGATYTGHPVAAAVANKVLDLFEERDLVERVRELAKHFALGLDRLSEHPLVGEARYVGLMGALELAADKTNKRFFSPAGRVGAYLKQAAEDHGVILRSPPVGDAVAFSPPLIITEDELDEVFARTHAALDVTAAWVQREGVS